MLVDAGPLVAMMNDDDDRHRDCVEVAKGLREPLITVWPALAEAMHLLNFSWKAQDALWEMCEMGDCRLVALDAADMKRMRELMAKYRDRNMDLADAALVRVAEREKLNRIFTLDRKDFSVYRPGRWGRFHILPEV